MRAAFFLVVALGLVGAPVFADEPADRLVALSEGASEDEASLLDQARTALEAADDPARDDAGRTRARALAEAALDLVEARRALAAARRARVAAETRREEARARREIAVARRAAAVADRDRRAAALAPEGR